MKQCPTCQSQYTDDTLQFCLQDGSPLYSAGSYGGEQETVVTGRQSSEINAPPVTSPTAWTPNDQTAEKKSNSTYAVFITAFAMLLVFGIIGIGTWLYYRGAKPKDDGNVFIAKRNDEKPDRMTNTATQPTRQSTTTSSGNADRTNSAPVDKEQITRDVTQRIDSWKSASENLDFESHMSHYADRVDYYNRRSASRAIVRADRQKAFSTYDSMKITLSNMTVTPDASGDTATAVFDKEWVFDGAKYSAGKVQTQLRLRRVGGQWLITSERDLNVYYTRN